MSERELDYGVIPASENDLLSSKCYCKYLWRYKEYIILVWRGGELR